MASTLLPYIFSLIRSIYFITINSPVQVSHHSPVSPVTLIYVTCATTLPFFRYYSGVKRAPILTLFIGGNHESSAFMQELPYGGWVAPNIYYMGLYT